MWTERLHNKTNGYPEKNYEFALILDIKFGQRGLMFVRVTPLI